jgi:hypothetical protein
MRAACVGCYWVWSLAERLRRDECFEADGILRGWEEDEGGDDVERLSDSGIEKWRG